MGMKILKKGEDENIFETAAGDMLDQVRRCIQNQQAFLFVTYSNGNIMEDDISRRPLKDEAIELACLVPKPVVAAQMVIKLMEQDEVLASIVKSYFYVTDKKEELMSKCRDSNGKINPAKLLEEMGNAIDDSGLREVLKKTKEGVK